MQVAMVVWNEFRNDARVLKEANTLQAAGHQVTVFALHTPGVTQKRELLETGVRVVRTTRRPLLSKRASESKKAASNAPLKPAGPLHQVLRLGSRSLIHAAIVRKMVWSRPDVVHAHDFNTLPTAWLAAALSRARLVYDAHEISTDREGYVGFRGLVGCLEKRFMPRAQGTITTTDARAKFFARAYGIPRPLVLQNWPRLSDVPRSDRIRNELGLTEPWPIAVYQGGLQPGRGLAKLVEAAEAVPNAYVVFIGGGRLASALENQVRELGLEERVRFIPTVSLEDLPSYTASADIGVQAIENTCLNHFTTDSNKLFEYMMAGLPVVASDLPEIKRVITGHNFGVLVPAGSTDHLAAALQGLVSDRVERARLASNARAASKTLNWDEQEQSLIDLYRRLER